MSRRFFTSDWHLNHQAIIDVCDRPFADAADMNVKLITQCNARAKENDIVYHLGDLFFSDRDESGHKVKPNAFIPHIKANFLNIEGNHDDNNHVKSFARGMMIDLGPFKNVSMSHYPTTDPRAAWTFYPGSIHLCGHVHKNWKYLIDFKNKVLNINVGCDMWKYNIIREDELINYITKLMNQNSKEIS